MACVAWQSRRKLASRESVSIRVTLPPAIVITMSSNTSTSLSLYSLNALAKLDLAKQTCASDNLVLTATDQRFEPDKPHKPTPPP